METINCAEVYAVGAAAKTIVPGATPPPVFEVGDEVSVTFRSGEQLWIRVTQVGQQLQGVIYEGGRGDKLQPGIEVIFPSGPC